jgi:hypothetical protein
MLCWPSYYFGRSPSTFCSCSSSDDCNVPDAPKDPIDTIRHLVEVMLREVATLPEPIPWAALLDSS